MIRRNLIKAFALGLCMAALWTGSAYAQTGGGSSPAFVGTANTQDMALFEKQKELDQYLFADHVKEIEKMGFTVAYTGVADNYVEIGITPYSEENAEKLYDIFGRELVKVVEFEEAILYTVPEEAPDYMADADAGSAGSPLTDMGDTPVSSGAEDEILLREEEVRSNAGEEEFSIQIEAYDGAEPDKEIMKNGERINETAAVEDAANEAGKDLKLTAVRDDSIKTGSAGDNESVMKNLSIPGIISAFAGAVLVLGGTAFAMRKKKISKNIK